jgi:hypothetical protein
MRERVRLLFKSQADYNGSGPQWAYYQLLDENDGVTPVAFYRFDGWKVDALINGEWQPSHSFLDELKSGSPLLQRIGYDPSQPLVDEQKALSMLVTTGEKTLNFYNTAMDPSVDAPEGTLSLHDDGTVTATGIAQDFYKSLVAEAARCGNPYSNDAEVWADLGGGGWPTESYWNNGFWYTLPNPTE